jgi:hypothetical protein
MSKDLTNRRFDRLLVIELVEGSGRAGVSRKWRCECDCGSIIEVSANSLLRGYTKSCKKASMLFTKINHYDLNESLFALNNIFPTIWSECNPIFEDKLEKLLFGESEEYAKRISLRNIVTSELDNFDKIENFDRFLSECIDLIGGFEMSDEHKNFLTKYNLDTQSIELMKSEVKHLMNNNKKVIIKC